LNCRMVYAVHLLGSVVKCYCSGSGQELSRGVRLRLSSEHRMIAIYPIMESSFADKREGHVFLRVMIKPGAPHLTLPTALFPTTTFSRQTQTPLVRPRPVIHLSLVAGSDPCDSHADLCEDPYRQDHHPRGRVFRYHR
jgi:hypothetical protein